MTFRRDKDSVSDVRAQIIGTWRLVSAVEHMADGSQRPYESIGPDGKGFLMYTADGHMSAAAMNPHRQAWKDSNKPTDAEKLRAIEGFFAYCGRYEIDVANSTICHYPEVAWMPNFVGTRQERPYKFDGDLLTFSDKATNQPGVESWAITWKKMKSHDAKTTGPASISK
ncbi:MAG TPA: lipocalin-like domain-containing protein [Candidatus Acidoferrales bacterium]|nr:lipocalin-like domain-containing protein [Candidatus Acidoferrales bacterium]